MTRERNVVLGSVCIWGILLFFFGMGLLIYESWYTPAPEEIVYPWEEGYEEYQDQLTASIGSSITLLLCLIVSIVSLYKIIKGISKWYVLGDRQSQPAEDYTIDL